MKPQRDAVCGVCGNPFVRTTSAGYRCQHHDGSRLPAAVPTAPPAARAAQAETEASPAGGDLTAVADRLERAQNLLREQRTNSDVAELRARHGVPDNADTFLERIPDFYSTWQVPGTADEPRRMLWVKFDPNTMHVNEFTGLRMTFDHFDVAAPEPNPASNDTDSDVSTWDDAVPEELRHHPARAAVGALGYAWRVRTGATLGALWEYGGVTVDDNTKAVTVWTADAKNTRRTYRWWTADAIAKETGTILQEGSPQRTTNRSGPVGSRLIEPDPRIGNVSFWFPAQNIQHYENWEAKKLVCETMEHLLTE